MNDSKKDNRRRVKTAAVLYLIVLVLAAGAAFGWFVFNREVTVASATDGDNIQIMVNGGDLEIFLIDENTEPGDEEDDSKWGNLIETSSEKQKYYMDISGDGNRLWFPKILDGNDQPIFNNGSISEVTEDPASYITLKLLFRTTTNMDVYLSADSCVNPLENVTGGTSFLRKSIKSSQSAPFSCDGIVGAARVALLEGVDDGEGESKVLKTLWIPNDNLELIKTESGTGYTLKKNGESEFASRGYSYLKLNADSQLEEVPITPGQYASGSVVVTNCWDDASKNSTILASAASNMANKAVPLMSFDGNGTMQYRTLYVRLWFEGTDREADSAFSGGMAGYKISFVGLCKEEAENAGKSYYYNTESRIICTGAPGDADYNTAEAPAAENLQYSLDGRNWANYAANPEGAHPVLSPGKTPQTVYLRIKETLTEKPGPVTEITIPAAS